MNPELEAFLPLIPELDLNDPVAARTKYAEQAAAKPAWDDRGHGDRGPYGDRGSRCAGADLPSPPGARCHRLVARRWIRGGRRGHRASVGRPDRGRLRRGGDLGGLPTWPRSTGSRRRWTTPTRRWPGRPTTPSNSASTRSGSRSAVTAPGRDSRPRWRCGRVTSTGRRSAFSCSTSRSSTTGRRPGRHETSPIRHGRIATRSPHRGGTTSIPRPPRPTPRRRGRPTCPACLPPTSPPRNSTRTATTTSPTRCGCCRRGCRSNCTSGPAPSTGRRRSCPPMSRSGSSPNSPQPCAARLSA